MNTLELAFGYRDAEKNIIWEKAKVSAQHPRKYYGCLSGEGWGRREFLPSLYYAKAYIGKAHGTIAFMDATGLRRWNAHYRILGYPNPSFDDSHSGNVPEPFDRTTIWMAGRNRYAVTAEPYTDGSAVEKWCKANGWACHVFPEGIGMHFPGCRLFLPSWGMGRTWWTGFSGAFFRVVVYALSFIPRRGFAAGFFMPCDPTSASTPTISGSSMSTRNCYRACQAAGIQPHFERLPDGIDPIDFVWSVNIHRRHLTKSQREASAADLANMKLGDNQHSSKEGRPNGTPSKQAYLDANGKAINCALMDAIVPRQEPVSIKVAAKKLGVSEGNVRRAAAVKKDQSRSLRRPQGGQDHDRRGGKEGQENAKFQRRKPGLRRRKSGETPKAQGTPVSIYQA
jgi:hypothetical protein